MSDAKIKLDKAKAYCTSKVNERIRESQNQDPVEKLTTGVDSSKSHAFSALPPHPQYKRDASRHGAHQRLPGQENADGVRVEETQRRSQLQRLGAQQKSCASAVGEQPWEHRVPCEPLEDAGHRSAELDLNVEELHDTGMEECPLHSLLVVSTPGAL
ncbi:hypothetical protein U0070_009288, partial [Myodes glareolus]